MRLPWASPLATSLAPDLYVRAVCLCSFATARVAFLVAAAVLLAAALITDLGISFTFKLIIHLLPSFARHIETVARLLGELP